MRQHLSALEAFDADPRNRLAPSELVSGRDGWWRWDYTPDNEKFLFYHILNRSLLPKAMLEMYNRNVTPGNGGRITFTGASDSLLLPEHVRKGPVCESAGRPSVAATLSVAPKVIRIPSPVNLRARNASHIKQPARVLGR